MTGRGQCLVLFLFSLILLAITWKSHRRLPPEAPVAFVRYTGSGSFIRIEGGFASDGVYKIPDGAILMDVINMAAPQVFPRAAEKNLLHRRMAAGNIVVFSRGKGQPAEISFSRMKTKERILLGMPLNPDEMGYSDWLLLPGIGPRLAADIIKYRQINGALWGLDDLSGIPGIGPGKIRSLISYF